MIAVLEAKSEMYTADTGLEQAKSYAAMLDVPFAYSSNGHSFIEFDFFLNRSRELNAFPKPDNLWNRWQQMRVTSREIYETELAAETIREDSATLGRPADPVLYPYSPSS